MKKLLTILLASAMMLSCIGCSSGTTAGSKNPADVPKELLDAYKCAIVWETDNRTPTGDDDPYTYALMFAVEVTDPRLLTHMLYLEYDGPEEEWSDIFYATRPVEEGYNDGFICKDTLATYEPDHSPHECEGYDTPFIYMYVFARAPLDSSKLYMTMTGSYLDEDGEKHGYSDYVIRVNAEPEELSTTPEFVHNRCIVGYGDYYVKTSDGIHHDGPELIETEDGEAVLFGCVYSIMPLNDDYSAPLSDSVVTLFDEETMGLPEDLPAGYEYYLRAEVKEEYVSYVFGILDHQYVIDEDGNPTVRDYDEIWWRILDLGLKIETPAGTYYVVS